MSEQENMDRLLRQSMAAPAQSLSSTFDRDLARRLRPPRLSQARRGFLILYALLSLAVSVWLMRREAIDWMFIAIAILAPLVIALAVFRRRLSS